MVLKGGTGERAYTRRRELVYVKLVEEKLIVFEPEPPPEIVGNKRSPRFPTSPNSAVLKGAEK
jgi:hypothetical protein